MADGMAREASRLGERVGRKMAAGHTIRGLACRVLE